MTIARMITPITIRGLLRACLLLGGAGGGVSAGGGGGDVAGASVVMVYPLVLSVSSRATRGQMLANSRRPRATTGAPSLDVHPPVTRRSFWLAEAPRDVDTGLL